MSAVDVVIVGGGPAGLSAALALGRAAKQVLLCDAGPRRNAAAEHMHGFLTRDGVPPSEFRRIAREQLRPYAVRVAEVGVESVTREVNGGFAVTLADGTNVTCRRVLLATGLVDVLPDLPGLCEAWGGGVFACPYCHGWELRDRRWGVVAKPDELLDLALLVTGWTREVVAFTDGTVPPAEVVDGLRAAGIEVNARPLRRIVAGPDRRLEAIETADGVRVPCEALVLRPAQRQIPLVERLGLALDQRGAVRVDEQGQSSTPGIYAAGDLATAMQAAVFAAAAGTRVAYQMNHALNLERAITRGSSQSEAA